MRLAIQFGVLCVYRHATVTDGPTMREYRDRPTEFHEPTPAELKARNKRNVALALGLAIFMIFVFVTMVSKGVIPNVS